MNRFILGLVALTFLSSCVDDSYTSGLTYTKPDPVIQTEYLNGFDLLKNCVDRNANPNFKLGAGVTTNDFITYGSGYSLRYTNFDELTPDSAMMHGQTVSNNGTMDFSSISTFIKSVQKAGMSVYGHALCWNSKQNVTYLNGIIQGKSYSGTTIIMDFESNKIGDKFPMTGNSSATVVADPANQSGNVLNVGNATTPANQSFPKFNVTLPAGRVLGDYKTLTFDFNGTSSTGLSGSGIRLGINSNSLVVYGTPSSFGNTSGAWGRGKIVLDLSKLNLSMSDKALTSFIITLGSGTGTGNYYIDNVTMQWQYNEVKTPEQKKEILTNALGAWISGMMKACNGYIVAWDAINSPMSDNDSFMLKSAATETSTSGSFYWQDYLGDNYGRTVVQQARQYFKENGGTESNLKLFVNDYGLEKNGTTKCQRLITMIRQWEADGITKIDGIGTDMRVVYSMDSVQQSANQAGVVSMFQQLAQTGKLIKISELNMDINDSAGMPVSPSKLTPSQQTTMAKYYNFIILKYFEIIPAAQRYGITKWNLNDTSLKPYGLWDLNFNRKYNYAGFASGLARKEFQVAQ